MMSRLLRSVLVVALVVAVGVVPAGSGAVAAGSVPGVPSGLVAAAGDGSVTLSWDDPSDPSITGYEFRMRYAGVAWGEWGLVAGGGSAVSHVVDGLDNGTEYRFKVRAVNGSGASKPAPSAAPWFVAAVPKAPAPPPAPPARPTGLAAVPGDGSVTLSWDDPSDPSITGYEFRMRYAGVAWGEWRLVAGGGSAVSHVVDGLDNGTEYRFKVRAVNGSGASKPAPSAAPWFVAAVPNEATAALTVANPTPGVASMTLGGYSGQWHYQAQGHIPPDEGAGGAGAASGGGQVPECVGPVEGGHAEITGLDLKADYVFGAYSDGGCTAEIASASSQSSVGRPGYPFEQYMGRTDGTLPVLWRKSATSGVTYDVVYSSDGGVSWARAATGVTPPQCTKDQSGGHNWANSVCYTITGPVGGSGNRMDNTATYIVAVRAAKGGVSSWWRNSAPPIDPVPEPRVTAYPLACPSSTDYVLYMSWAKLPESGTGFEVRYKIGNGAWVNLPAEDSSTPDHRKVQGAAHSNSRWLEWMDQLPAQNTSYEVTAQVRRSKTFKVGQTLYSAWGERTFNAGQSSDVKRRYTRCPDEPTEVSQSSAAGPSTTVAWTAVTGPHDYDIRYRISSTGTWADAAIGHASTSYTITGLDADETYDVEVRARVWDSAAASDWQRATVDYDADDDNLIEISTLAQLNAIRWDTDGNGLVTGTNQSSYRLAFPNATAYTGTLAMGCTSSGCDGYELAASLDFDTNDSDTADSGDAYWNSGSGWNPIGGFNAELDGNGNTISNLFISRNQSNVGLFARLGGTADISELTLDNVDVNATNTGTEARAGALAGELDSGATASGISASGDVDAILGAGATQIAGGLVGRNLGDISDSRSDVHVRATTTSSAHSAVSGGIAGKNEGDIATSYFTGFRVEAANTNSGTGYAGGIAGEQSSSGSSIKASYSTGQVTVTGGNLIAAGGIVGNMAAGTVEAVYATGQVYKGLTNPNDKTRFHGVIGHKESGTTVAYSYYDSTKVTHSDTGTGRGEGKTTTELQTPTDYTGIYADWNLDLDGDGTNDDPWNFGTASDYPVLK